MEQFLDNLRGIVASPSKTFQSLAQDTKNSAYLIWLVIALAIIAILNNFIPRQPLPPQTTPTAELVNQFLQVLSTRSSFLSIPVWAIGGVILHLFARIFSKSGSLAALLVSTGFIGIVGGSLVLILSLINIYVSILNLISPFITLWLFYLMILAVSFVYSISKKKGFVIVFAQLMILVLVFMIAMFTFVLRNR